MYFLFNPQAYWRAAQAAKNLQNGIPRALDYIIVGLRQLNERNTEDFILFLTELCILIPTAPPISEIQSSLDKREYLVIIRDNFC